MREFNLDMILKAKEAIEKDTAKPEKLTLTGTKKQIEYWQSVFGDGYNYKLQGEE